MNLWVDGDYLTPANLNSKGLSGDTSGYHSVVQSAITNLTWASVVTPDASYLFNRLSITSTAPFTIASPSNRHNLVSGASFAGGTELILDLTNLSGASNGTITMASVYLVSGGSALSTIAYGDRRIISFYDDGTNLVELYHSAADLADITIQIPAASVTIAPSSATLAASSSQTTLLSATVRDAFGNVLAGRTITWSSSDNAMATVTAGPSPTAVVTAVGDTGGPNWPNKPTGLTLLTDYPFSSVIPGTVPGGVSMGDGSGWAIAQGGTLVTRASDGGAPLSPPYVAQFKYPVGFVGGYAPGNLYYSVGGVGVTEFYYGLRWKVSDPWQWHSSGVQKICQQFTNDGSDMILQMYKTVTPPYLRIQTQFNGISVNLEPNIAQTEITLGAYHTLELHVKRATGLIEWWLDGVLQGLHTGITFPAGNFIEFQNSPTWGGTLETKVEDDYFWYDHAILAGA